MSNDTLLDRLFICNQELAGINSFSRLQPTKPIEEHSFPLIYAQPMGMTQPVSRGPSAGQYIVYRRYMLVIVVDVSTKAAIDDSDAGSKLLSEVSAVLDTAIDYYMKHPRLDTDAYLAGTQPTQGEIALVDDVAIIDNGPEFFGGSDGRAYAGVRPIITIAERRQPTPKRLS